MIRHSVRTIATTALRAAGSAAQMDAKNPYGVQLSKTAGVVDGLVGGKLVELSPISI